ncbi:MAG: site-specific tyrosine recombinase XerC [Acidobacteria bacterium]|nr:site-specific tyrosine recombinase XerC [Acidobacteriota bacterium]
MDQRKLKRKLLESEVSVEPGTLGFWARRHLRALEVQHYSPMTLQGRRKELRYFLVWCEERAVRRPEEVTVALLERYQRHIYYYETERGERLSFRSQRDRLLSVRRFFRWLAKTRVIEMSPAELLELPRPEYRLPKAILSVDEVESIMAECDPESAKGIRDRAVLELLYATGIRRFEITRLKVWDVDPEQQILTVRLGKGRKDRRIPMGERASAWVGRYLREVRPGYATEPDDGTLFLTKFRRGLVPERVSDIARAAAKSAGITKSVSAHTFRHTCATLMLEGGADIRYVQAMLGHKHLSTTEIYTRVAIKKLQQVHEMAHPGAKLERKKTAEDLDREIEDELEREELLSSLAAEEEE